MPYRSPAERGSRISSLALVVGLHGAAIAAALLAKSTIMMVPEPPIVDIYNVDPIDDPEPLPPPESEADVPSPAPYVTPNPVIRPQRPTIRDIDPIGDLAFVRPPPPQPPVTRDPAPPPPPVLIDARFASSMLGRLQPPYPAALLRAGIEGEVRVRVTIGPDGRVKRVEKIGAGHDAFFEATERHARRVWRFEPATRDGRPIESSQVHIVRFEIHG
ncbi:MAG: energy transducer TonB [Parasphingopyxis sp.]|nr:energy transducer TonB [Sphingomonadales bacterium]